MNQIITLTSGQTNLELWTFGARINAVSFAGSANLLDGSNTIEEASGDKLNHGSICGPVANRIAGATADIDGKLHEFERNENGVTLLHSGAKSTRDSIWSVVNVTSDSAVLGIDIADGADDFPGNRRIETTVRVFDNGFDLAFTATTDAPTLMNLAWHPYWSLGTDRAGLKFQVNSDRYLPVDDLLIPTGEIADVADTIFDLREMAAPSDQIDHNFCFPSDGVMRDIARLTSQDLTLDISSDAPGLQVFTGKPFGIAIEPQHWPDAPHHGHFPSVLLRPGETYRQSSRFRISANA